MQTSKGDTSVSLWNTRPRTEPDAILLIDLSGSSDWFIDLSASQEYLSRKK